MPWSQWNYEPAKSVGQIPASFTMPAGWNTVATFDRGISMQACEKEWASWSKW